MTHKITDEMVLGAIAHAYRACAQDTIQAALADPILHRTFRRDLEAALSKPEEPEIEVTEEMVKAGQRGYTHAYLVGANEAATVYRAMRKLDPAWKERGRNFGAINVHTAHRRKTDPFIQGYSEHRRKDDP